MGICNQPANRLVTGPQQNAGLGPPKWEIISDLIFEVWHRTPPSTPRKMFHVEHNSNLQKCSTWNTQIVWSRELGRSRSVPRGTFLWKVRLMMSVSHLLSSKMSL